MRLLMPLAILFPIFIFGCATPSQMYWDHKVKELCEKDGGVTVYETVELTKAEYDALPKTRNYITVPIKALATENQAYYSEDVTTLINKDDPSVRRVDVSVIRKSDKKILAKYSTFHRVGGDIWVGINHPSHFACPDQQVIAEGINSIFLYKGD